MTPLTPPTEEAKIKLQAEIDEVHAAFRDHVGDNREGIDAAGVATGEAWLAALAPEGIASGAA